MNCTRVVFTGHAIQRMFERAISRDDVLAVIEQGEAIAEYTDDKPHPSRLLLGFVGINRCISFWRWIRQAFASS
jgi:hypothetical protein